MDRQLTREEKALMRREFFARDEVQAKRRGYFRKIFFIGVPAATISSAMIEFRFGGLVGPSLFVVWLLCTFLYTDFLTIPRTFSQDMDPRWHLNPWQESLQRLASENRQIQGIVILTIYPICRGVFSFIAFGFGIR